MAKITSVWGIEIGQSALKALRCKKVGDDVVAEAFDYIEYPKILSQPEAEPEALVREALQTFASRNDLKKCKVALSVSGQSGLAKFFKPPPVELSRVPDIVKYEAKQQIPFDLNDVVWDFQQMAGANIEAGFALESEVGLFAMKRDSVYRAIRPLKEAGIEVDLIQLAPLCIYNMITYDQLPEIPEGEMYDPDHPPKSTVVLAMGTDATDLIVTNGYRVWQRSMPLGGNHFTRQLTKDLKLTFAKAEHLKRNAMEADDPKLVFQAMRPVFNDLVTEVQRSIGFFRSLNKKSELGSIVMLGNTVKLTGLAQYLSKNLGMDVHILEKFQKLTGDEVLNAPAFRDNQAAFGPVYGLCLQQLGKGPAFTNLVPGEILSERRVRAKKPWVVMAAAGLLIGFVANLMFANSRWANVREDKWKTSMTAAEETKTASDGEKSTDSAKLASINLLRTLGSEVSGNKDRRILWVELLYALCQALDRTDTLPNGELPTPQELPYQDRKEIHIVSIESKYYEDIAMYLTEPIKKLYIDDRRTRLDRMGLPDDTFVPTEGASEEGADATADVAATAPADTATAAAPADAATTTADATATADGDATGLVEGEGTANSGWVVQFKGYTYHNGRKEYRDGGDEWEDFVLKTFVHKLETGSVVLPINDKGDTMEFTYQELGISNPFVLKGVEQPQYKIPNIDYLRAKGMSTMGAMGGMSGMSGMDPMGGMGGMGSMGMGGGMPGSEMGSGMMGVDGGMGGAAMPGGMSGTGMGMPGMIGGQEIGIDGKPIDPEKTPKYFDAPRYDFTLQLVWQEKPLTERVKAKEAKEKEAQEKAAAEAAQPAEAQPPAAEATENVAVAAP